MRIVCGCREIHTISLRMDAKRNQSTAKINDCSFCHVYCQPRAVVDYTISTAAIWMSDKLLEASQIDLPARVLLCVCVFVISFCPIWCLTVFFIHIYCWSSSMHLLYTMHARSFWMNVFVMQRTEADGSCCLSRQWAHQIILQNVVELWIYVISKYDNQNVWFHYA